MSMRCDAEHCDGQYVEPTTGETSFYTLHLYLNDSAQGLLPQPYILESPSSSSSSWLDALTPSFLKHTTPEAPEATEAPPDILRGGATTFFTDDMQHKMHVYPRAGRVLIFQHRGLLHSGGDVEHGVKFTMRTDLLFQQVDDDDE